MSDQSLYPSHNYTVIPLVPPFNRSLDELRDLSSMRYFCSASSASLYDPQNERCSSFQAFDRASLSSGSVGLSRRYSQHEKMTMNSNTMIPAHVACKT